jgi:2-dehydro-3-deoxyphosphogluconate aldolase/(4S)-4-hydroxy-2-oxoglutarate aldolase
MMNELQSKLIHARAIAIIRGDYQLFIERIAQTLLENGVRAIEVTLNSPGALDMIARLSQVYGDQMLVGAGTVLDVQGVNQSAAAGARFIVSPDTCVEVIQSSLAQGLEPLPGVLTPTEARTAMRAGARLLKLFPATLGGVDYLKQIRAPLHDALFVPTGGISAGNAAAYLTAGAVALGIGSWLVPAKFDGSETAYEQLGQRAAQLMNVIRSVYP